MIHAAGESEAAQKLSDAAEVLDEHRGAMQLRLLATVTEVAGDKNSTLVLPIPTEFLSFVDAIGERSRAS